MIPRIVKPLVQPLVQSARLLTVAAAALVCLLWVMRLPAFSQDSVTVPDAPGSLSGRVSNAAGDPLPGIEVQLYHPIAYGSMALTGPDGRYTFLGLPPATYLVEYRDPNRAYASQFYGNVVDQELAVGVAVSGNDVTGIDAVLAPAATVLGTLKGIPSIELSQFEYYLYRRSATLNWVFVDGSYISPIGATRPYTITGLAAGTYLVCGAGMGVGGYFSECYEDTVASNIYQPAPDLAGFPLMAGETRRVDMIFGDISQLSGRVLGTDGKPLAGVTILAADPAFVPPVSMSESAGGIGGAMTGSDGSYRFGYLSPGSYVVRFDDPSGRYFSEYYSDVPSGSEPSLLPVTDASRHVIDATLTASARVTGTVTLEDGGHPFLISLTLWRPAGDGIWEPTYTTLDWEMANPGDETSCRFACYDPVSGRFSKGRLAAGRYHLSIRYTVNGETIIEGFYGGATVDTAADIVLTEGETRGGVDIVLGVGEFEGSIAGRVRAGETALAGIEVALFDVPYGSLRPLISTLTDAEGRYRFEGLLAGGYWVGFRDPAGQYAPTFYRDQPSIYSATPLTLTKGQKVDAVNAALAGGGSIRGTVRRVDGAPATGYWVVVDLTNAAGEQLDRQVFLETRTDANGDYRLPGLAPGRYYVSVWLPGYPNSYPVAFYPQGSIGAGAQPVTVEAGKIVEGIDITIGMEPALYLPFVDRE